MFDSFSLLVRCLPDYHWLRPHRQGRDPELPQPISLLVYYSFPQPRESRAVLPLVPALQPVSQLSSERVKWGLLDLNATYKVNASSAQELSTSSRQPSCVTSSPPPSDRALPSQAISHELGVLKMYAQNLWPVWEPATPV